MREPLAALFPADSPFRRLARGTAWGVLATLISRLAMFAAAVVAARLIGRESFGQFGIVQNAILAFSTVGSLGMGLASTKLVAQHRLSDPPAAARFATLSLRMTVAAGALLAIVLLVAAPFVAGTILDAPALAPELRIAAGALFFTCWSAGQLGVLAGVEAFPAIGKLTALLGMLTLVGVSLGAWTAGLRGAVWGLLGAAAVACLANQLTWRAARGRHGLDPAVAAASPVGWRQVWSVGLPAMLSNLLFLPVVWACAARLVNQPDGFRQMALFSAADQWFNLVITLPAILGQATLPVLTNVLAGETTATGNGQSRALLRRILVINTVVSFLPLLVVAPLADLLMRLYGPEFQGHGLVLILAVATGGITAYLTPAGQTLAARNQLWLGFAVNLLWAVVFVVATQILVVSWQGGALGLVIARGAAYLVSASCMTVYMWRLLRR